jgi:hypothetical protein
MTPGDPLACRNSTLINGKASPGYPVSYGKVARRMRHGSSSFPTQMKNGCSPVNSAAWNTVTGLVPDATTRPSAKPIHWPRY